MSIQTNFVLRRHPFCGARVLFAVAVHLSVAIAYQFMYITVCICRWVAWGTFFLVFMSQLHSFWSFVASRWRRAWCFSLGLFAVMNSPRASLRWNRWETTSLMFCNCLLIISSSFLTTSLVPSFFFQTGNGAPRKQQVRIRLHECAWILLKLFRFNDEAASVCVCSKVLVKDQESVCSVRWKCIKMRLTNADQVYEWNGQRGVKCHWSSHRLIRDFWWWNQQSI